jgi:hypothetical protein
MNLSSVEINLCFFRYLTGGQLKVQNVIIVKFNDNTKLNY